MNKRLNILIAIMLLLVALVNGQQTIQGNFMHDSISRNYLLYVPASYSHTTSAPLVINLHGYGSNALEQMYYSSFMPIADTAGFLVVHPNGTLDFTSTTHWNTFGFSSVDDIGFISALIDTLASAYNINLNRVYSTGMSNGGFMSYSLACFLSSRIAAIASVTGTMTQNNFNTCNPGRPVPVMQIHGTADLTVPYNGNALFVPVQDIINKWVTHNNCLPNPIVTQVPDIDTTDGCTAEHHLFEGGSVGATVELYKVIGGGHSWPGAPVVVDVTNMDFNASAEIWRFFRQYDINGLLVNLENHHSVKPQTFIWPNPSAGAVEIILDDESDGKITVINGSGQIVKDFPIDSRNYKIDLPARGLYLIIISKNGIQETHKVVRI